MGARFKIQSVTAPHDTDAEGIVGRVSFVWVPEMFDEIRLNRWERAPDGAAAGTKGERKAAGQITFEGRATFRAFSCPIREYSKEGKTSHFLSLDGLQLPYDTANEITAAALVMLPEAIKRDRMRQAGADIPHDDTPAEDIPF